jgi:hypothetical protein
MSNGPLRPRRPAERPAVSPLDNAEAIRRIKLLGRDVRPPTRPASVKQPGPRR